MEPQTTIDLTRLAAVMQKPPLFAPGDSFIWSDPHIAKQMLAVHLDQSTDLASRRTETIDRTVAWILDALDLTAGDALLDLGCGPGLYTSRFAAAGLTVTGVDLSANSLAYAREHDPASTYLQQNYVELDVPAAAFDAVTLIFGDFCVLSDAARDALLRRVVRALKPGGAFICDVTTPTFAATLPTGRDWTLETAGGFWKPGPHLVLEQPFTYPEHNTTVTQYVVLTDDGQTTLYRNWLHHYSPETLTAVLNAAGLTVTGTYGDLTGAAYTPDGDWLGIIARKPEA
jgi:ubiquinone/menaquinone biosynthesis C-methylase UbiE